MEDAEEFCVACGRSLDMLPSRSFVQYGDERLKQFGWAHWPKCPALTLEEMRELAKEDHSELPWYDRPDQPT